MSDSHGNGPRVLSLLEDARERPEDDTPRLVLADYLEDHGDAERSEFIRLQCQLAAGRSPSEDSRRHEMGLRCEQLRGRRGGCWLGPLWNWPTFPMTWHRGLLSLRLTGPCDLDALEEILPWIDTALFVLNGRGGFRRVADFLGRSGVNHLHLDLRSQLRVGAIREALAGLPESRCLRTLSVHRPMGPSHRAGGERSPPEAVVGEGILASLLGGMPVGRHLTHVGSSRPFGVAQNEAIRGFGVEPVVAEDRLWMHRLPPASFRATRAASPS